MYLLCQMTALLDVVDNKQCIFEALELVKKQKQNG